MFSCCCNLCHVEIPSSVVTIGNESFHACTSLKNIFVPRSVKSIGDRAFSHCHNFSGRHKYPHEKARRVNGQCANTLVVDSSNTQCESINVWHFLEHVLNTARTFLTDYPIKVAAKVSFWSAVPIWTVNKVSVAQSTNLSALPL